VDLISIKISFIIYFFKIIYSKHFYEKSIFLALLLGATTFAVAQEDLSAYCRFWTIKPIPSGIYINMHSSLQQISKHQEILYVEFLLLMDTKLFLRTEASWSKIR
jgi:hypothetical protein